MITSGLVFAAALVAPSDTIPFGYHACHQTVRRPDSVLVRLDAVEVIAASPEQPRPRASTVEAAGRPINVFRVVLLGFLCADADSTQVGLLVAGDGTIMLVAPQYVSLPTGSAETRLSNPAVLFSDRSPAAADNLCEGGGCFRGLANGDSLMNRLQAILGSARAAARAARIRDLQRIRGWSRRDATLVADGQLRLGMTIEMAIESLGAPDSTVGTVSRDARRTRLVYGRGGYLYFGAKGLLDSVSVQVPGWVRLAP